MTKLILRKLFMQKKRTNAVKMLKKGGPEEKALRLGKKWKLKVRNKYPEKFKNSSKHSY